MKWIAPDYYGEFACLMGACRHTCCAGWGVDIDEESMQRFLNVPGSFGDRLKRSIDVQNGCFRMKADNSCPFLNGEGLCDLILELGEDSLCQICADHPRFRNFFTDREEIGLGLSCEAAGRLILGRCKPVELRLLDEDDDDETCNEEEEDLLFLRGELIKIVQDRSLCMQERIKRLLAACDMQPLRKDYGEWARFLLELERLDDAWAEVLAGLENFGGEEYTAQLSQFELPFEQLMVYLMYRNLPAALVDGDLRGRIYFVVFIWELIRALCAVQIERSGVLCLEDMVQLCRMYSSEIEYSDENADAIVDWLSFDLE